MNYEEAIKLVSQMENGKDLVSVIECEIKSKQNEYTKLDKTIKSLASDLGVEPKDVYSTVKNYKNREEELTTQLTEKDDKYKDIESKVSELSRKLSLTEAASITGAKLSVLQKLASDNEIVIEDKKAYVSSDSGKIELNEYAKTNWEDFLPSLYPTATNNSQNVADNDIKEIKTNETLPTGTSAKGSSNASNDMDKYLSMYSFGLGK